ncbi:DMT family transporter [Aliamphritea hakodatensis]|uniref:DMT family transporter n=1 Tax=Aliamphritea hakodatensis TaxID=2895352 RepID=UPI0022FD66E5|nr:EamA family transporter [Aliamphritea hakodatensis]
MLIRSPGAGLASAVVFFSAALWGIYWIPLRFLEEQGISGTLAVAVLNMPAILPLLLLVGLQLRAHRGYLGRMLLIGIFTGMAIALYSSGVIYSSVVRATLLFYLTPVWATLIEIVWFKEKAGWPRWLAAVAGLVGMALLLSGEGSAAFNIGDVFGFFSGVCWAFGAAMIKRYDSVPLPGMLLSQFCFTVAGALLLGLIAGAGYSSADYGSESGVSAEQILAVLPQTSVIAIGIILPAVLAIFWAQKFLLPGRVGLLMMSEVIVAVASASLLLPEEHMSLIAWCGAGLIISACVLEVLSVPDSDPAGLQPAQEGGR